MTLKEEYEVLKRNALYAATEEEWVREIDKILAKRLKGRTPTLQDVVEAARDATVKCDNCNGSGVYQWGACVNGIMTKSGPCFRCQQKGRQGQDDFRRNWSYDNHRRVY